jgi:hypothetical protein
MNRTILITMLVLIVPVVLSAQINWTEHTIKDNFDGASSVFAVDLDNDDDVDVLGTALDAGDVIWWENDSNENFTEHVIDDYFAAAVSVYAIDMDDDGDIDVLGAAQTADDIAWWENDGNENFTEHTIKGDFDGAKSVFAIDLDDDGDIDVLGAAYIADDIAWWENDGDESFTEHTIAADFDGATSICVIDLDDDGDLDVVGGAYVGDDVTWWENDGDENFTEHTIATDFDGAWSVCVIDLDDDDDIDIIGAANYADDIAWWENDGDENFTEHTIAADFDAPKSVFAIDLDDDGDIDVLGVASLADDITWWESDLLDICDVSSVSIDIPDTLPEDTTFYPQASVTNLGSRTETFPVTCKIEPGAYTKTQIVQNLAPGDSTQVSFLSEFTFESGTYIVTVYTRLDDDMNLTNDTLEKVIVTYDPGIEEGDHDTPLSFSFDLKNNPAKGKIVFNLTLPEPASISLQIYDVSGRLVERLTTIKSAGHYEILWTPNTTAGVYFYSFTSPWKNEAGKLVVLQ